ncbi:hypothetical protein K0M31_009519 [Melipona bicolor]|uniref:Uncharacterized protein n=1 Tax=Melipona bicolor TaxID=60889 RepID=A0AA40FN86_9HYME|nr:hypothetical protein K0M31_009519 [Melipona bicolor]
MVKSMKVARQEATSREERETETKKNNRSKSSKVKISDTSVEQNREGTRDYADMGENEREGSGKRGRIVAVVDEYDPQIEDLNEDLVPLDFYCLVIKQESTLAVETHPNIAELEGLPPEDT